MSSPSSLRTLTPVLIVAAFLGGFFVGRRFPGSTPAAIAPAPASAPPSATATLTVPAGQPVAGFLDQVGGKTVLTAAEGADLPISGWAGCADPQAQVKAVELLVDNQPKASTTTSSSRPDVAAAYGRPDFEKSGWKATLPTRGLRAGTHPLSARVTCTNGQAGVLPAFQLNVTRP